MPSGLQAIRDGVIEASINHEKGYVQSKEMIDIYSTREPQLAFHQRISFCLDIHNMSVKVSLLGPYWEAVGALGAPRGGAEGGDGSSSGCDGAGLSEGDSRTEPRHFWALMASPSFLQAMRFPPKSYNKDLESAEVSSAPGL